MLTRIPEIRRPKVVPRIVRRHVEQFAFLPEKMKRISEGGGAPLCNVYAAMLERMGTAVQKFGDSTEAMALDG